MGDKTNETSRVGYRGNDAGPTKGRGRIHVKEESRMTGHLKTGKR